MKYKVFIDTCIYKRMKYQFASNHTLTMDLLKSQIDMNKVEILMPIIVKNEILSHLTPDKNLIFANIRNAVKNATKDYPWMINENYEISLERLFDDSALKNFEYFLKNYKCKIIPYSYANIEKVFNKYFNNSYPFQINTKKKNEFPDAFSIDMIKNYLKNDLKKLIVITTDEGVKNSFPKSVPIFSSINELLGFLNSEEESSKDIKFHLQRIEVTKEREIYKKIQADADSLNVEIIDEEKINKIKKQNIFLSSVHSYNLIGKKDNIIYVSALAYLLVELEVNTFEVNIDEETVSFEKNYNYTEEITYNLEIKINGIDDYEIIKITNNLYQNTMFIERKKMFSILLPI